MRDVAYGLRWCGPLHAGSLMPGAGDWPRLTVGVSSAPAPPGPDRLDAAVLLRTAVDGSRTVFVERDERRATFYGAPIDPGRSCIRTSGRSQRSTAGGSDGRAFTPARSCSAGERGWCSAVERPARARWWRRARRAASASSPTTSASSTTDTCSAARARSISASPRTGLWRRLRPRRHERRAGASRYPMSRCASRWPGGCSCVGETLWTSSPSPLADRLALLARWRGWRTLRSRPEPFLALAALPGHVLTRPRRWDVLAQSVETVLALAAGGSRSARAARPDR